MGVYDFHSHILPGIDDGAKDLSTSMEMLEKVCTQKVDIMAATPHFYASRDRIDSFLKRRGMAWDAFFFGMEEKRKQGLEDIPRFILGSEVAFFDDISRAEEIELLTYGKSNLMLLEMPFVPWTQRNIEEVAYLLQERGFRILIAHLERYLGIPGNKKQVKALLELPVFVQLNAEALLDRWHRHTYLKMFAEGTAHVLGSDCHGAHHRVPNLQIGRDMIGKKKGRPLLEEIDRRGYELLCEGDLLV